ncbi:alcohol dehydrogenase 1-like [Plectropomus leopardus]|uniref:alcohol dehydrogenase 1-like n=1 Tax=Plectropomus leopardus TaxID=160734 RepID=UPI001C4CAE4C|nr:alcohol dehydrogenase 1-like [Plectropomus leopardus]
MAAPESCFSSKGKKVLQFGGTGTFSEYTVVNQMVVAKINTAAPLDKVCIIGCGFCTGYGAAINNAKVKPGSTCALFGLGAVGLAAVMGCKAAGAKRIIAVDINPEKAEKAKVFGATDFVKPISEVLSEMIDRGVDYSLEWVGNVDHGILKWLSKEWHFLALVYWLGFSDLEVDALSRDLDQHLSGFLVPSPLTLCFFSQKRSALESCVKGWGVSVTVGWTNLQDFSARPLQLISGRTWKGSLFGGFKGRDAVPQMVKTCLDKKLKVDKFITHYMTLDQVNDATELMKQGKCIQTVLNVSPQ